MNGGESLTGWFIRLALQEARRSRFRISSHAVYAVASAADETYYRPALNRQLDYGAVNLLYWFLPDRAWAGVEYLYGRRQVIGGEDGTANRIQFAVRFNFPS